MLAKRSHTVVAFLALLGTCNAQGSKAVFDPHARSEQELAAAERLAGAEHKNILLDFGANWCPACKELNQLMSDNPEISTLLQKRFIVVHANVGGLFRSNKSTSVIRSLYPAFRYIPDIMILTPDGKLVHNLDGHELADHDVAASAASLLAQLEQYAEESASAPASK